IASHSLTSNTPTFAPAAASRRAIAAPIPCPAPVTRATRPAREKFVFMSGEESLDEEVGDVDAQAGQLRLARKLLRGIKQRGLPVGRISRDGSQIRIDDPHDLDSRFEIQL